MRECERVRVRECESERVNFEHRHENKSCSVCEDNIRAMIGGGGISANGSSSYGAATPHVEQRAASAYMKTKIDQHVLRIDISI